jgi:hypothetical protein
MVIQNSPNMANDNWKCKKGFLDSMLIWKGFFMHHFEKYTKVGIMGVKHVQALTT